MHTLTVSVQFVEALQKDNLENAARYLALPGLDVNKLVHPKAVLPLIELAQIYEHQREDKKEYQRLQMIAWMLEMKADLRAHDDRNNMCASVVVS